MKTLIVAFLFVAASGCVEFGCYSNVGSAVKKANEFCSRGNGDKELCESLTIDGKVCGFAKDTSNKCLPLGYGIQTFVRIPYHACTKLKEEAACRATQSCDWTFKDTIGMKFGDLIDSWP